MDMVMATVMVTGNPENEQSFGDFYVLSCD